MDTIRTYLDNAFAAFPKTEKVQALKHEMLASMEEKYQALKADGKNDNEAIGSVIANFGSINEIAAELGITSDSADEESGIYLSGEEAFAYLERSRRSGVRIGLGVWLILAGVCAHILMQNFAGVLLGDVSGVVGMFVLFAAVAAAVSIFIVNGVRMERYEQYDYRNIRLDMKTHAELERLRTMYTPRFTAKICAGIATIILAAGAFIFSASLGHANLTVAFLVFVVGFAVFLLITAGTTRTAIDVLFNQGDYENKTGGKKADRIIETVAGIYWPVATAVFLVWGFAGGWGISWVVWPVAGILFGAFCGGVSIWFSQKSK